MFQVWKPIVVQHATYTSCDMIFEVKLSRRHVVSGYSVCLHTLYQVTQRNKVMWVISEHVHMLCSILVTIDLCTHATGQYSDFSLTPKLIWEPCLTHSNCIDSRDTVLVLSGVFFLCGAVKTIIFQHSDQQ